MGDLFSFFSSGKVVHVLISSLISTIFSIIQFLFGWIPSLPKIPNDVLQMIYNFFDLPFTSGAVSFVGWLFGSWTILIFVLSSALAVFLFRFGYDFVMFVLRKLPIGVK